MAIELFKHNQDAYLAAMQMLQTTGKAAVIHPTGTGKSFIAFKLCEDHPDQTICWLSPSGYIFKTQLENLKKAGGGNFENICFFTYARSVLLPWMLSVWFGMYQTIYGKGITVPLCVITTPMGT